MPPQTTVVAVGDQRIITRSGGPDLPRPAEHVVKLSR